MKTLKIWNGRGYHARGDHIYIAAYSRADAARLYCEGEAKVRGITRPDFIDKRSLGQANREIKEYFADGCWGIHMDGITPERGLWYSEKDYAPIKRII